ncbi:glycine-rich cell wall structural protein-like [Miscanthus floridulus]|uniref:glycine-rich cell wall structural protein-like n=1 Tax=Miscanthus floridulus TaxID=154761 RepID=UPI003459A425
MGSTLLLLEVVALAVRPGVVTCVHGELQVLLVAVAAGPVVGSGKDGEGVRGCALGAESGGGRLGSARGDCSRRRWRRGQVGLLAPVRHGSASGAGSGGELDEEGEVVGEEVAGAADGWEVVGAAAGGGVGLGFYWGGLSGARGSVLGVGRRGEVNEEGK